MLHFYINTLPQPDPMKHVSLTPLTASYFLLHNDFDNVLTNTVLLQTVEGMVVNIAAIPTQCIQSLLSIVTKLTKRDISERGVVFKTLTQRFLQHTVFFFKAVNTVKICMLAFLTISYILPFFSLPSN